LSNDKLVGRAERMVMEELKVNQSIAQELLKKHNNVRAAIAAYKEL